MFFFFFIEDLDNAKRIHFHSLAIVLPLLLKRASFDRSIDRFTSTNQPRRVGEELLFETKERFTSPIHLREFSLFCHEGSNYHGWRLQMHDHPPWDTLKTDDTSRARSHFATSLPIVTDLLRLVYIRRAIKLRSNYAVDDWQLVRGDPLTIPVQQDPQRRLVETRTDSLRHAFCFELLSFVMLSFSMIFSFFFFFFSSPSSIVRRFVTFKRRRFAAWVKSSIRCVSVDDIRDGSSLANGEKQIGNLRRSWSETRLRKRVNRPSRERIALLRRNIDPIDFAENLYRRMWKRRGTPSSEAWAGKIGGKKETTNVARSEISASKILSAPSCIA